MGAGSGNKRLAQRAEQGPSSSASIVNELEQAEIERQLLLRDTAMQPGSQQRPEALEGVDLAEAIAVLVPGVFASTMTDGLVAVAETRKSGVDAILVGINVRAFGFSMIGWRVACWTLASIRITTWPPRSIMPKIGGFSFSRVPRPPFSLLRRPSRPLARTASGLPLCPAIT